MKLSLQKITSINVIKSILNLKIILKILYFNLYIYIYVKNHGWSEDFDRGKWVWIGVVVQVRKRIWGQNGPFITKIVTTSRHFVETYVQNDLFSAI